jgi:hypothetical protein
LTLREEGFGVPAEWHFFLTSHDKSACDAMGRTAKRLVANVSLQQPYADQVMAPRQLFRWAQTKIQNMNFEYVTELEFIQEKLLYKRNSMAKPIHGTL